MSAKTFEEFDRWLSSRHLSTEKTTDAWGQPIYLHAHIQSMFDGWNASRAALLADAPDVARVAREYRDNAAKYPIDSEAGQRLGFVAHCIESLAAQSAVQQARIRELVCQSPSPVRRTP